MLRHEHPDQRVGDGHLPAVEIAAIAVMVVLGFAHAERGPGEFLHAQIADGGALGAGGVGAVMGLVPVACCSPGYRYGAAIYYVEETKNAATIGRG